MALTLFDRLDLTVGSTVQFATYVIVMFYGCEVILGQVRQAWERAQARSPLPTLLAKPTC